MNWHLFTVFILMTTILVLVPGPIVTLVISTAATKGTRAALTTVAGTSSGNAVLVTAIAFGLSWVLAHALYLFELLRWLGAAYLIWLGLKTWRSADQRATPLQRNSIHFWRGFLVAVTNPKGIAFFTAFLPQFVDPRLPAGPQLSLMCIVAVVLGAFSDSCWAILSGLGRAWFMKPARAKLLGRASGLTLIGGGLWLSLARRPT